MHVVVTKAVMALLTEQIVDIYKILLSNVIDKIVCERSLEL